ncbi:hypothetical protein LUZ60_005587 [Juncus effusus]|nr:hypothetical protein LUZ60_005587 [Juncus effusus]
MAVLLPSDEYWFEIKFKPKHSKWLQTIISEVNEKLKAIAKLVEEDADSFSRRSEMYFENRPLLMKMVQDLYRSYRSLADRYDIATRALSQTHLICESFSNQSEESPRGVSDMSTHGISDMDKKLKGMIDLLEGVADSFAKRAEMYYKHRPKLMKLVEELYRAFQTLAERYDTAALYMNRAYRTISEALINQSPPSVSATEADSSDMRTRVNSPLDRDELQNGTIGTSKNVQLVRRSVTFPQMDSVSEIAGLEKEISNLSDEMDILKEQIGKVTKRANEAEKEVLDLTNTMKNLSVEKDALEAQCQIYSTQLIQMEEELAKAEKDVKGLADGWSREVQKISTLENSNRALKRELERLKGELEPSVVQSEKINWMNNKEEFEPWSLQKKQLQQQEKQHQKDNDELILVLRDELERIKTEAEDTIYLLRKELDMVNHTSKICREWKIVN